MGRYTIIKNVNTNHIGYIHMHTCWNSNLRASEPQFTSHPFASDYSATCPNPAQLKQSNHINQPKTVFNNQSCCHKSFFSKYIWLKIWEYDWQNGPIKKLIKYFFHCQKIARTSHRSRGPIQNLDRNRLIKGKRGHQNPTMSSAALHLIGYLAFSWFHTKHKSLQLHSHAASSLVFQLYKIIIVTNSLNPKKSTI